MAVTAPADSTPMSGKTGKSHTCLKRRRSNMTDRRPTLLCAHVVEVHADAFREHAEQGLLEEIAAGGAKISLSCPVRSGAAVRIDCRTCELRGKVVDCQKWVGGYLAEVEFPAGEPWSPAQFVPKRLFNPKSLICTTPGCTSDCVNESCVPPSAGAI